MLATDDTSRQPSTGEEYLCWQSGIESRPMQLTDSQRNQAFEREEDGYVVGHVKRDVILRVTIDSVCRLIVG